MGTPALAQPGPSAGRRILLLLAAALVAIVAGVQDPFVGREPSPIGLDTHGAIQGLFDLHRGAPERGDRTRARNGRP